MSLIQLATVLSVVVSIMPKVTWAVILEILYNSPRLIKITE